MPKPQSLWCFIALCGQQSGTRDTRNSGGPVGSLQSQKFSFGVWSKSLLVCERTQHAALYLLFWLLLNQTGFANFGSFHVGLLCLKFAGAENKRGFRMIFGFIGRSITLQTRHQAMENTIHQGSQCPSCWLSSKRILDPRAGGTLGCSRTKQWTWTGKRWGLSYETLWKVSANWRSCPQKQWALFRFIIRFLWNSIFWTVLSEGTWNFKF